MAIKKPIRKTRKPERRVNPFTNVGDTDWGHKITDEIAELKARDHEMHFENSQRLDNLETASFDLRSMAIENREAIAENTKITTRIDETLVDMKATLTDLSPVATGVRGAKKVGSFAWAAGIVASKVGRWAAGIAGFIAAAGYLLHEKWIEAWKALMAYFR